MIRLVRAASLLVAFSVLTSAATAYAECAWVLWLHRFSDPRSTDEWSVVDALESRRVCDERMTEEVASSAALQVMSITPKNIPAPAPTKTEDGALWETASGRVAMKKNRALLFLRRSTVL